MTWVIAHRGASADERENTLPAFERAIAVGADFVELDVQVSADGALVVFHDVDLDRLTPLRGPLGNRPLAELREHAIPTLEDVLELTRGRIGVMAELKSPHLYRRHDVAGRTAALLGPDDVLLSFSRRALLRGEAGQARPPPPPARRARRLDPRRVVLRVGGRVLGPSGDRPRAGEGAKARPRDDRLHGERARAHA